MTKQKQMSDMCAVLNRYNELCRDAADLHDRARQLLYEAGRRWFPGLDEPFKIKQALEDQILKFALEAHQEES